MKNPPRPSRSMRRPHPSHYWFDDEPHCDNCGTLFTATDSYKPCPAVEPFDG